MFIKIRADELSTVIDRHFSDTHIDQIARSTGFVKRSRKLKVSHLLNTLMFSAINPYSRSLPDMSADLNTHFEVDISKEGLHKRFNKCCVAFFKELVSYQLSNHTLHEADHHFGKHFPAVYIKDSSKFSLPSVHRKAYPGFGNYSKTNGLMNVQYEFDLVSGNWKNLELTSIKINDQQDSNNTINDLDKGALYIRDLGYITPTYLKAVTEKQAYFLNRIPPPQAAIYTPTGKLIQWKNIKRKFAQTDASTLQMDVLLYKKKLIKCRLVIESVTNAEYRKRLKAACSSAKRHGVGLSDEHRIRCRYNAFITNADREILPADKIKKAYYLRWQIELVFKTWKSTFEIHKVRKTNTERMECQLLAKLLWILLNWRLFQNLNHHVRKQAPDTGISLIKFFKRCVEFTYSLRMLILKRLRIKDWLTQTFLPLMENTRCEPATNKKTHYQWLHSLNSSLS